MRIPDPADKAKEIEACAAKIAELLEAAKALDDAAIPDSVKNLSVWELEGTPVRVKNMLNNIGVRTLWELVHFDMAKYRACRGGFFASKHRLSELRYAIKEAMDLFSNPPKPQEPRTVCAGWEAMDLFSNPSIPANPFTNEEMANNPIAQRVVMKVCAHKVDRLDMVIDKHYVRECANCEFHADDLKLNKWRVVMRWICCNHPREAFSEWGWRLYKTVAVVRPGDLCAQRQHLESHLVIGAFDSEEEAKNLCAYLKTKFVIFLVACKQVLKLRQIHPLRNKSAWYGEHGWERKRRELSWNSFEYVPVQDFSKPWTDAELYKEYDLGEEEVGFIESALLYRHDHRDTPR